MISQREMNKAQGGGPPGGHGGMGGMDRMSMERMNMDRMNMDRMGPGPNGPGVNIPPSLMNNPNIPNEIIHGLQAGRIGSTVFVANVRRTEISHAMSYAVCFYIKKYDLFLHSCKSHQTILLPVTFSEIVLVLSA